MAYQRSWHARLFYKFSWYLATLFFSVFFRLRIAGIENLPAGPGLVCCNHQSHLDPVLVGIACREPISFLARHSLFQGPFSLLIKYMGAIPINREGSGLTGIKLTMERLKANEKVLIFPEGTRTPDGEMRRIKGGFSVIARRSHTFMVPMALAGAYASWPKRQWLPMPTTIQIVIGEAISSETITELEDEELISLLEKRMRGCWEEAKRIRSHRIHHGWFSGSSGSLKETDEQASE